MLTPSLAFRLIEFNLCVVSSMIRGTIAYAKLHYIVCKI